MIDQPMTKDRYPTDKPSFEEAPMQPKGTEASVVNHLSLLLGLSSIISTTSIVLYPVIVPDQIEHGLRIFIETVGIDRILTGLVILLVMFGIWKGIRSYRNNHTAEQSDDSDLSSTRLIGEEFDQELDRILKEIERSRVEESSLLKNRLRHLAIELESSIAATEQNNTESEPTPEAWTDDPVVAAFLTNEVTASYPLTHRLYAWLVPEKAFKHRIKRTINEFEHRFEISMPDQAAIGYQKKGEGRHDFT